MNTFGNFFRITTFGESHGKALGVVIDNCPPGVVLSESDIQKELDRRRPGQSAITSPRDEADQCEILSGTFEGKTTGTPIAIIVHNQDQRSKDYSKIKDVFRPSHADFGFMQKYGIRDYRGGGRSSARETVGRVAAGAIAKKILKEQFGTEVFGFTDQVGHEKFEGFDQDFIEKNPLRMADAGKFDETLKKVEAARDSGDSLGGVVQVRAVNVPVGLGSPVFGKLEAELARAMMSVGATKGFEMGEGFSLVEKPGSEANDPFIKQEEKEENFPLTRGTDREAIEGVSARTQRNANGGILGGISTGEDIWFRVAIKPTSSIAKEQTTVNKDGETEKIKIEGRHDPILVPRAVPILEAMTALVLLDHAMLHRGQCGL
ncbi:MAG TPA: chorismate synthase [Candidatus Gracilibacteria bacterium]